MILRHCCGLVFHKSIKTADFWRLYDKGSSTRGTYCELANQEDDGRSCSGCTHYQTACFSNASYDIEMTLPSMSLSQNVWSPLKMARQERKLSLEEQYLLILEGLAS